jgi:hypothetical protein
MKLIRLPLVVALLLALSCRDSKAVNSIRLGMTLEDVQKILGGEDVRVCAKGEGVVLGCFQVPMSIPATQAEKIRNFLIAYTEKQIVFPSDTCTVGGWGTQVGFHEDKAFWILRHCGESYIVYDVRGFPEADRLGVPLHLDGETN